jgi:hypothetical protein
MHLFCMAQGQKAAQEKMLRFSDFVLGTYILNDPPAWSQASTSIVASRFPRLYNQAVRTTANLGLDWGLGLPANAHAVGRGGGGDGGSASAAAAPPTAGATVSGNLLAFGASSSWVAPVPDPTPVTATPTAAFDTTDQTDQWVDFGGSSEENVVVSDRGAAQMATPATFLSPFPLPAASRQQQPRDPGDALAAALGLLDVAGSPSPSTPARSLLLSDPFGDLLS